MSTQDRGGDDEGQPPEDGERAVAGAPDRGARGKPPDLRLLLHGNDARKQGAPARSGEQADSW
jgi:hypothetical protein